MKNSIKERRRAQGTRERQKAKNRDQAERIAQSAKRKTRG